MKNKIIALIGCMLITIVGFAQEEVEMADGMRSEGKIYVLVAIITAILVGLLVYLVLIDRKVSKTEAQLLEKNS